MVEIVHVHLDESAIGSGLRLVIAQPGRKWVQLTHPFTLERAKIPVEQYRRSVRPGQVDRERIVRHVRKSIKRARRLGLGFAEVGLRELLTELGE
jgi:hypothetical protein